MSKVNRYTMTIDGRIYDNIYYQTKERLLAEVKHELTPDEKTITINAVRKYERTQPSMYKIKTIRQGKKGFFNRIMLFKGNLFDSLTVLYVHNEKKTGNIVRVLDFQEPHNDGLILKSKVVVIMRRIAPVKNLVIKEKSELKLIAPNGTAKATTFECGKTRGRLSPTVIDESETINLEKLYYAECSFDGNSYEPYITVKGELILPTQSKNNTAPILDNTPNICENETPNREYQLIGLSQFQCSDCLNGTAYLDTLPDDVVVNNPFGNSMSVRECALTFNWLLIVLLKDQMPSYYDSVKLLYGTAMNEGVYDAANNMGAMFAGIDGDIEMGNQFFDIAIYYGNKYAALNKFVALWSIAGRYQEAIAFINEYVDKEENPCCNELLWNLAILWYQGDRIPNNTLNRDTEKVRVLLQRIIDSHESEDPECIIPMSKQLFDQIMEEQSVNEQKQIMELPDFVREEFYKAKEGNPEAQCRYGYYLAKNPKADRRRAIEMFALSAKQGYSMSKYFLSVILFFGDGVEKDFTRSKQLCIDASNDGCAPAKRFLQLIESFEHLSLKEGKVPVWYSTLYETFVNRDVSKIKLAMRDDVRYSEILGKTIIGKENVVSALENYVSQMDANIEIDFIPTERYGTVIELYRPGYRRILVVCRAEGFGVITNIAFIPSYWGINDSGIYYNAMRNPFGWNEIERQLHKQVEGYHEGHMFCMKCGTISKWLDWIHFESAPQQGVSLQGQMSVCTNCNEQVEFIFEELREEMNMNYFGKTYKAVKQIIADNYKINCEDDFNIIDANFLLEPFTTIQINPNKTLGIYRHLYGEKPMGGFYSQPYFHDTDAKEEYYPNVKCESPRKAIRETLLQKLHLASCTQYKDAIYSTAENYKPSKIILKKLDSQQSKSVDLPSKYITARWNEHSAWEVFLLDHLKYFLPTLGHANYVQRELICLEEDLDNLPTSIISEMCADRSVYLPFIEFDANGQVNITVHYFNKWKGLVKWTSRYVTLDDVERGNSVCCYNKLIQPGDAEVTVISYDCGTRY